MEFLRILIAVDGSEASTRGVEAGAMLATRFGAEVILVTAVSLPQFVARAAGVERGNLEDYIERMGRRALASALKVLHEQQVGAEVKIAMGPAAETIVAETKVAAADLVVMGRHGRTEPKDLVLGSISDRVARNITVPILLIP